MIKFDMPKNQSSIIKVIGVGGGGSNAINHMYHQGIQGVDFIICNTDAQAMELSPVPTKIQLGDRGLGAGSIPSVGKEAATQKIGEIREILEKETKMLFITAGMGGGTGTGAAPVIASQAKDLGILTVGIVTLPFSFEGRKRRQQAEEGINELRKYVDTLLVIGNDKLRELYGDLKLSDAFNKADDVLTTAAKGIAEIITVTGYINVDFEDVKTVMKESGKAIMGSAEAEGENRAMEAIQSALSSPLLNDNDIEGASNVLLYITSGEDEISMDEVTEITDYIQREAKSQAEIIWGNGTDTSLDKKVSITLIATGFDSKKRKKELEQENKKVYSLNEELESSSLFRHSDSESRGSGENPVTLNNNQVERVLEEDDEDKVDMEKITLLRKPESATPVDQEGEEKYQSKEDREDESKIQRSFVFDITNDKNDGTPSDDDKAEEDVTAETVHEDTEKDSPFTEEDKKPFEVYVRKPAKKELESGSDSERKMMEDKTRERIEKLKNLSYKLKTESGLEELEKEPAYKRKKVDLDNSNPSEESKVSRFSLYEDEEKKVEVRSNNSFLHDNVD